MSELKLPIRLPAMNDLEIEPVVHCSECDATDLDFTSPDYCHGCGAKVVNNEK